MKRSQPVSFDVSTVEGTTSGWILEKIQYADSKFGAAEWTYTQIILGTAMVLFTIKFVAGNRWGVRWWSLIHCIFTGYGSLACVWLNINASVALTGTTEPLRSILCQGPLTSLHQIVPTVAAGYGLVDMVEGISHGMDFFLHGLATFSVMSYFTYYNVGEIIISMLLMELSTVHLNFTKATFLPTPIFALNMGLFIVFFLILRLFVCPYLWWEIFITSYEQGNNPESQACLPWHFKWVSFGFGMFFNLLNAFWSYKIIRKVQRKMSGQESLKGSNELKNR